MKAQNASYVVSATKPSEYPPESLPEFAFAGRSNVGKSSLINKLVGVTRLARTSNTPGRTRLLNWFYVEPQKGSSIHIVDLPGYGYARVPREMRDAWRPMVEDYLVRRSVLRAVFVLIDARRGAQEEEADLLEWLAHEGREAIAVVTKTDKLPKSKRKLVAADIKRDLGLARTPIATSAESGEGIAEIWRSITQRM